LHGQRVPAQRQVPRNLPVDLDDPPVLEPNREYYIRVSATAKPSNGSFMWPFGSGTSAQGKFTFIR